MPRHPHGNESIEVHPQFNTGRAMDLGNDNSSNQRQARSQSARPDKVPGEWEALTEYDVTTAPVKSFRQPAKESLTLHA